MKVNGVRATSVAHYISLHPKVVRTRLREMRALIAAAAPEAKQELKWGQPAFIQDRILVMFGGFKQHIGLFPTPEAIGEFREELAGFKVSSATIQFPLDQPLPKALIRRIVRFRVRASVAHDAKWRTRG